MSSERWRQIERLYQSALKQEPARRSSFLSEACGEDDSLRQEVENLLRPAPPGSFEPEGRTILNYQVIERIGEGGMGTVYKALDLKLDRPVALKFLARHLLDSGSARLRFRREARALSALNHPNIATILDVEEADGTPFLVLEFLPGGTLREKIRRLALENRTMPLAQALEYGIQIASGLTHAHQHGVLHRDIKTGNVLFTAENALKITDFGLAKFRGAEPITATSGVGGTVAYMAPEQLRGEEADDRADIYSFGVVLYEMVAGELPFRGGHEQAIIHQILNPSPRPLREIRPGMPPEFEAVIARAMHKDHASRYQAMAQVLEELMRLRAVVGPSASMLPTVTLPVSGPRPAHSRRWIAASIAAAAVLAAGLGLAPAVRRPLMRVLSRPGVEQQRHLAVLPFVNVGNDAADQAFAEGVVETLTSSLTQLERFQGSLLVVPASEVRRQSITSVQDAARSFGINLAVTGSVQRTGNQVRLTVNLVDARTLRQLGARTADVRREELYRMEDRLIELVAELLDLQLPQGRSGAGAGGTSVPDAYDAYVQGRGYLNRYDKPGNVERAMAAFQQALQRDPHYALAYTGLGEAYLRNFARTKAPEWLQVAAEANSRAIELNGRLAPAHVNQGMTYAASGRYEAAVGEFQRAIDLDSLNASAYREMAAAYEALNKMGDAEATYKRALRLRPNDWLTNSSAGAFYYRHARFPEAEALFRKTIELTPDNHNGYLILGGLYIAMGKYDQAETLLKQSLKLKPTNSGYSNLGTLYFERRRYPEAVQMYEKAVELGAGNATIIGNLADSYRLTPPLADKAEPTYRKAIEQAEQKLAVNPRDAATLSSLAVYRLRVGERNAALSEVAQARKLLPADTTVGFKAVLVQELVGHRVEALGTLRDLVRQGYVLDQIEREPELEHLRADPEYIRLAPKKAAGGASTTK